jgi:hypothetical protein
VTACRLGMGRDERRGGPYGSLASGPDADWLAVSRAWCPMSALSRHVGEPAGCGPSKPRRARSYSPRSIRSFPPDACGSAPMTRCRRSGMLRRPAVPRKGGGRRGGASLWISSSRRPRRPVAGSRSRDLTAGGRAAEHGATHAAISVSATPISTRTISVVESGCRTAARQSLEAEVIETCLSSGLRRSGP